jgi:hypothetical protein
MKKLLIIILLYLVFFLIAGNKLNAILYLSIGPIIAYLIIKVLLYDGLSSFVARMLYGEQTVSRVKEDFCHVKRLMVEHKYEDALNELELMESDSLEAHKLKMTLLYENFNAQQIALQIGLKLMNCEKLDLEHIEILNLCVDICLEMNNREMAISLLSKFGAELPSGSAVNSCQKRLEVLESQGEVVMNEL